MTLIEARKASLRRQVECILRDQILARIQSGQHDSAPDGGRVVERFGVSVAAADGNAALKTLAQAYGCGVYCGISDRSLPGERLHCRNTNPACIAIRRFQNIEASSFSAGIVQVEQQCRADLLLDV